MTTYANRSGESGVREYLVSGKSIVVKFHNGDAYVYDGQRPGAEHVQRMAELAAAGRGLSTYIAQQVRNNYARRLE